MTDSQAKVLEFTLATGSFMLSLPGDPPSDVAALRMRLLREELHELDVAVTKGNVVEVADALGDLQYVLDGTALAFGIDMEPIIAAIHASNMTKIPLNSKARRRRDGKVLKPSAYKPPELRAILVKQKPIRVK